MGIRYPDVESQIETLFLGLRPSLQKASLRDWHKFTQIVETPVTVANVITSKTTAVVDTTATASANNPVKFVFSDAIATALVSVKTIDRITISAHGISLYNDIPADFFNYYTTYTYGGPNINTPTDQGVLMIPFNLYPYTLFKPPRLKYQGLKVHVKACASTLMNVHSLHSLHSLHSSMCKTAKLLEPP